MKDYRKVVDSIDLRYIVAGNSRVAGSKPVLISCPFHEDKTPSMAVYKDHAWCFSCSRRMTTLDYIAYLEGIDIGNDFCRVIDVAESKYTGKINVVNVEKVKQPEQNSQESKPLDPSLALFCHGNLGDKIMWLTSRGLKAETIREFVLGYHQNAYTIPHFSASGDLLNIKYRRDDFVDNKRSKYWGVSGRQYTQLYNCRALHKDYARKSDFSIVLTEGEFDCMRLWQEGINCVSVPHGVNSFKQVYVHEFTLFRRIFIAYDMDKAGYDNSKLVKKMLGRRARVLKWNESIGKDVSEFLDMNGVSEFRYMLTELNRQGDD